MSKYSSKFVNICELSNEKYDKEDNNLIIGILDGSKQLSNHHCFGNIQYHKKNKKYFDYANMFFEYYQNLIQHQSWGGKNINIQRSNGKIQNVNIYNDSCLRYFHNKLMFYVEFIDNGQKYNKWVSLLDYIDDNKNIIFGILTLNPKLMNEELFLTIYEHPEWMNKYREEWKELFSRELNRTKIKYKFIYKKID